jgi:hypothetical protein
VRGAGELTEIALVVQDLLFAHHTPFPSFSAVTGAGDHLSGLWLLLGLRLCRRFLFGLFHGSVRCLFRLLIIFLHHPAKLSFSLLPAVSRSSRLLLGLRHSRGIIFAII